MELGCERGGSTTRSRTAAASRFVIQLRLTPPEPPPPQKTHLFPPTPAPKRPPPANGTTVAPDDHAGHLRWPTLKEKEMNILGWLLFGLVVGAIAKFLMPGRDPGGWIVTILLGIAGSFVGGFLASILAHNEQTAGCIGSIIGAIVLLFIYRLIVGRRVVV